MSVGVKYWSYFDEMWMIFPELGLKAGFVWLKKAKTPLKRSL